MNAPGSPTSSAPSPLRDSRLEFAQTERDVKLGKLISYGVAKPFPVPSHELFRRLQGSSSIDDLIAALEKEIVGGPHPAVVAGERPADAFAARARADLLEHELRETMKRVSQLEESEKTASALVRSLKEQVAQLENRNISLHELHQSTNLERDLWSTERGRLDATIRDKDRIIASMTADYHRDAGNRQLVLGRCYELTAQVRQLSDAVAMGNPPAHQLLKLQLADIDNEIRRVLRTLRMSPVVSEFQRRSPFLVVTAMLGEFVSWSSSSSDGFGRCHARSPSVSRSSARSRSLSVSARVSQLAPSSPTRNTIVRRPRSPSVVSGTKRRHSPDSDADSSGSALTSGHASSRSSTSSRSHKNARATPTPSPVSSQKSSSKRSTNKKAAKSRTTVSHSPSEVSDGDAGFAPLRRPRRTAAANCSAIQRLLHAGESDSDSEVLGEAAAISSSSGHGRQASSRSAAVSSTSAPPPSSQVTSTSPTQAPPDSIVDLASANTPVSSPALAEVLEGANSSGIESSSTTKQTEAASMLASLSGATKSVVIRALPPGKHPAWSPGDSDSDGGDSTGGGSAATPPNLSNKLVESSDSSGDESTLADPSKPKSQAGSAAPVSPKTPTPARFPVRPATSTPKSSSANKAKAVVPARSAKDASKPKPASKAKPTAAIRSAKDGSKPKSASKPSAGKAKLAASDTKARAKSDGGVPPHHVDVKVLVARAAASARLDYRESGPMKRLLELPFFHKGSKRCWEKIMSSCAVSVIMEKTADGERIKPTPCSIAGLAAFMDVDDSGHHFFVDDSVLEVCPPVEKGKRSKKPGSLLEVLSHEWCKSRGVVREDILLALWERMHWIVESSDYLLGRKQRTDLLRLTAKVLGGAVVGAANNKIDGLPAPLVDTEVCFDSAIPFCPPVNLPWFPRTADSIAEAVRIDNHEPWRLWWLTTPGRHPYNTIFRLYHTEFPLFVPEGADSEMVSACVDDERLIAEPEPPALHPNTPAPVNRPGEIEFCPPNIVHSA
ncbi:unnamed protein product [Phytophthora fragariaefolia]|uniref:Unnamed protein product n=1 Tax=Phytophthora fragariaefolia TaxID=1490495 RepID=A0A9W6XQY1_9STRA|nr:unnamed protein product [Phytophthora fragariaefolia]